MAFRGKVLGGVLGFVIGAPLGALLGVATGVADGDGVVLGAPLGALFGVAVGHRLDRFRRNGPSLGYRLGVAVGRRLCRFRDRKRASPQGGRPRASGRDAGRAETVFTVGVITLAAKVAKADGAVTRDEILAFRRRFEFPPGDEERISVLYNEARRSADGYEVFAQQLRTVFQGRREMLAEMVDALYAVAAADGTVHPREDEMIARIGAIFGLSPTEMAGLRAGHAASSSSSSASGHGLADAYATLEVSPDASDEEIRRVHRDLVRKYHPDRLVSQGLPEEFLSLANDRLAAINAAHDAISKERGGR